MQGTPLRPAEERIIDTEIKFMASRLKDLNYKTSLVGKWHMGHYNRNAIPSGRGFDHFVGYYNGLVGYFDYIVDDSVCIINNTCAMNKFEYFVGSLRI